MNVFSLRLVQSLEKLVYGGQRHCHCFSCAAVKDSALLYGDGSCFNAMVGITRSKVISFLLSKSSILSPPLEGLGFRV